MKLHTLSVGSAYPHKIPNSAGAISEFLTPSNTLYIFLSEINKKESKAFKKGRFKCSLLAKNGAILLVWQFYNQKGRPVATFDSPFDARIIPDINLPHVSTNEARLLISVIVVDTATNTTKALLAVTMPPDLTLAFLSSVQDQLVTENNGEEQMNIWLQQTPKELFEQSKQYTMGL